jgi:lysyl-tRNA synthetase class I
MVNLRCKKCSYEVNLWIGSGMVYNALDKVIGFFDKPDQVLIEGAIKRNPKCFWYVTKEIGICERCGKISAVAAFKMTTEDGTVIQYQGKCPCGGEVDIVDSEKVLEGKTVIYCPVCKEALVATVTGHWD